MCGGYDSFEDNSSENSVPARSMKKVAAEGTVQIRNNGFGMTLQLVDTELKLTAAQQDESYDFDNGFTKAGHPIMQETDLEPETATALLRALGKAKPRKGGTVVLG